MARQSAQSKQQKELNAIFSLHKEGIRCFEQDNIEVAKDSFKSAFSAITRLLRETRNRDSFYYRGSPLVRESEFSPLYSASTARDPSAGETSEQEHGKSSCLLALAASTAASPSTSPSTTNDDDLPLFTQALHLPKSVTVNQFVFVTLYNLAISTHIAALSQATSSKQETLMKRAAQQWGLVYALQWRPGLNLKPAHGLAILLNLGHAKSLTGNESGSNTCYQNILSAIHILESRRQNVPNRGFFLYNAFRMLGGRNSVIAASAA